MIDWKKEYKTLLWIMAIFLAAFYLPTGSPRFDHAITVALNLVKWYAREHVLLCLVPAFFIAGAISVFVSQDSVMKYLGPGANKVLAYGVASVSGTILAVCSCTVLPLFSGIYSMGAGLGPASAFLYSGPAINVLAIILTARILGMELGLARALGAILFSIVIGLLMDRIFRREGADKADQPVRLASDVMTRPMWQTVIYFTLMIAILVFANWGRPGDTAGFWRKVYDAKWILTGFSAAGFAIILGLWFKISWQKIALMVTPVLLLRIFSSAAPLVLFAVGSVGLAVVTASDKGEAGQWFAATWDFAKKILPLLLAGVFVAGLLLGRVGHEGLIPSAWVSRAVGGNSFFANFFASLAGTLMYFATLTEVPIVQGLINSGMGNGPALTLLLAGPALSLPSLLVLRSILGIKKTAVFVSLVVLMATLTGILFGFIF